MRSSKVVGLSALLGRLRRIRRGKKIVFTNGCFDLIHRGHADYLSRARSLGDTLVVGINTDSSVRRLKDAGRPILPLADRQALLSALECVDYVVPFAGDTPIHLIRAIRPDVLVKGADYSQDRIVGADVVRAGGGRVVRIKLTAGRSTSGIIRQIRAMRAMSARGSNDRVLVVIPARYGSTRFLGKALADMGGKSVLHRVFEQAQKASAGEWHVIIATDDRRIFEAARSFGAEVMMTSAACRSGSDRCAEIARKIPDASIIVNLQGDEPFQPPENIRLAVQTLLDSDCPVATLAARCPKKDISNPNVAKVALSPTRRNGGVGRAVFFSRNPIPFYRGVANQTSQVYFKHIGLYVFRRDFLMEFSKWKETALERAEKLEQLRILEHGRSIAVAVTKKDSMGIDTPEDLRRARKMLLIDKRPRKD